MEGRKDDGDELLDGSAREGDVLWTIAEYAQFMGITPAATGQQRFHATGPRYVRVGPRSIRYWRSDVLAWLDGRVEVQTPGEGTYYAPPLQPTPIAREAAPVAARAEVDPLEVSPELLDDLHARTQEGVARRLRRWRAEHGVTQEEVAEAMQRAGGDVNRQTEVSDMERGRRRIFLTDMVMLAAAMTSLTGEPTSVADLLTDTEEGAPELVQAVLSGRSLVAAGAPKSRLPKPLVAEERCAKRLGIPLYEALDLMYALWGESISNRSKRLTRERVPSPNAQHYGITTRALESELREYLNSDQREK